ncbi:choice-of-anchor L domain-containing protein [Flavobacteriales bacterium]|nr:choice-of-anchor L domain-containing protein [Flavobacteriales bacterium]
MESKAQIGITNTAPNNDPTHLINNVLVGSGVAISNISFTGSNQQIGAFTSGNSIGMASGIVMSSGHATDADLGGNPAAGNTPASGGVCNNNANTICNDLYTVANSVPPLIGQWFSVSSINDAAVLEFDFTPESDTIRFNYCFGSEEYLTYINTAFNDVFGFFISGPGITGPYSAPAGFPNGSINIATVPNSSPSLPITISSINPGTYGQYYNTGNTTISYNGYTDVFTAEVIVQACQTYHIRLAIADGSDDWLDSGVFLEANSFSSPSLDVAVFGVAISTDTLEIPCNTTIDLEAQVSGSASILWNTGSTNNIINVGPGQYHFSVTYASGACVLYSDTITIVETANLSLSNTITNVLCNGASTGAINLTVTGGTPQYTYLWSGPNGFTNNSEDLNNLAAGIYSVIVTDGTGCTEALSNLTIQQSSALTVSAYVSSNYNGEDISCYGASDGQITANVSGGMGPYTYSINNSSYSSVYEFDSLTAGLYSISYKDDYGCNIAENIFLSEPSPLYAIIASSSDISCFGAMDGSIDITISGGIQNISSPSYNVNWLATNGFTSGSTDLSNIMQYGTYTATITDANGCEAPTISEYIAEPTALNAITIPQPASCYGYNDGGIQLQIFGGSGTYTSSWVGPNGFSSVLEDLQGLFSGTYTYTVTDAAGCSLVSPAVYDVFIAEPPPILVTSTVTLIDCYGNSNGSIDLNISGITGIPNFLWSGPNSFYATSSFISGLQEGVYSVIVTDPSTNCTFPLSEIINPISTYNIDTYSTDISCKDSADGEIIITEYNLINPTYSWIGPNNFTSSQANIDNLSPGNYQVEVNDDNDCPVVYSFDILEPSGLSVLSSLFPVSCEGGTDGEISLVVAGGEPPYTYIWSNASANLPLNSNLSAGPYAVAVLDSMNCPWHENYLISTEPFDTLSVNTTHVKCKGELTGKIDIDGIFGGVSPFDYAWSNGAITEDLINIGTGNYMVSITDATSCTIDRWISITEPNQVLSAIVSTTTTACYSSYDGKATLDISGGVSPYDVEWFGFDPDSLLIGSYQYQVIDNNDCPFTDNFIITGPDSMIVIPTIIDVQCNGEETGEISLIVQFGTGVSPYTYSWTGPNFYSSNNKDIYNLGAGEYICTITDYNGCQVVAPFNVDEPQNTISSLQLNTPNHTGFNIACKGGSNGWIEVDITGGVPPFTFLWSNGETTQNIYDLSTGTYQLTLTDALFCNTNYEIFISEPDSVVSALISTTDYSSYGVSCHGYYNGGIGTKALGGVGGYSYEWTKNDILIAGATTDTIFNCSANNYQVFISDQNGCPFNESIILTQPEPLVFDTIIFAPDTCELKKGFAFVDIVGGVPNYKYSWKRFNGDTIASIFYVDTLSEGVYEIVVEDENLCNISHIIDIGNLPSPIADFSTNPDHKKFEDQLIHPFVFIDNSKTFEQHIINWDWDFDYDPNFLPDSDAVDSITSCSYADVGIYQVLLTIETEYNCLDTISKYILVDQYELYIPNAFTPSNNDTINSEYFIKGVGVVDFKMIIYSKWGGVVYSSEDINEKWNGTINGKSDAISGIYTYYIEVRNIYNEIYKYEGTIKLFR